MERYTLILKHEAQDENGDFVEVEDAYKASVLISTLYDSLKFIKEDAVEELCKSMIKFMKEEKDV